MREIKFRGISKETKKWIYGWLVKAGEDYFILDKNSDKDFFSFDSLNAHTSGIVIPKSIGQFTGLKDKNGKEIYEGDIVEIRFQMNTDDKPEFEQVVIEDIRKLPQMFGSSREPKVIGNIYENPELLEKGR